MTAAYDVDVIQMSDFRLPGGTTSSIAEEVRAQSSAELSTAMIHIAGGVTTQAIGWSAHIRRIVGLPGVIFRTPSTPLRAKVLVIRHPTVLYTTRSPLNLITADHILIVANHAAIDAAGTQHYDVAATDAKAREIFGQAPIWSPIGPVVRGTMREQTVSVPFRETDWFNIFNFPDSFAERTGFVDELPVIGRHSRPQRGKWPDNGTDILDAYPESSQYRVRILGGAQIAQKLLGHVPHNWEVIPFGGEDPISFLNRIDFWVYMHHPHLKEAFGRAAMESLAAGCVAIMPLYMKELFGDAALYAEPSEVQALVDEYSADLDKFLTQSRRAQDFAKTFSPQMHIDRLAELGAVPESDEVSSEVTGNVRSPIERQPVGRTLIIIDGRQTDQSLSAFVAMDSLVDDCLVLRVGEDIEPELTRCNTLFVSSSRRMNMVDEDWDSYFAQRLSTVMEKTRPQQVIYSGALPPAAVADCLHGTPVRKIWNRQPPVRPEQEQHVVRAELGFHTVCTTDLSVEELQAVLLKGLN